MTFNIGSSILRTGLQRKLNKTPIRAILGDASGVLYDPLNPNSGYIYVRQQTSNGFSTAQRVRGPYQGAPVQMIPGTSVILLYDADNQLYVAGPDFQGAAATGANPIAHNASDENANQWTNQASIVTLVSHCTAPPSTSVIVRGWMAIANLTLTWFSGGSVDLSSLIPSAGNQCIAVVVIKSDYTTLAAYASTAKASVDVLGISDIQEALTAAAAVDPRSTPIWAWRLHDAQTAITDADSWLDVRQFLNLGNSLYPVRVVTAAGAVTVTSADYYVMINKTVGAATTVNLPSSPVVGQTHVIKDKKGDAATNNITLTPAAGNIDGAGTYVMNINRMSIKIVYDGTEWSVN